MKEKNYYNANSPNDYPSYNVTTMGSETTPSESSLFILTLHA